MGVRSWCSALNTCAGWMWFAAKDPQAIISARDDVIARRLQTCKPSLRPEISSSADYCRMIHGPHARDSPGSAESLQQTRHGYAENDKGQAKSNERHQQRPALDLARGLPSQGQRERGEE